MPCAFFGPSGRTDATLAALLVAHASANVGPTTLVRVLGPGDERLAPSACPDHLIIVESDAPPADRPAMVMELARQCLARGDRIVLDLPASLVEDPDVRAAVAVPVLVVGPSVLDEAAAASAFARAARVGRDEGTTPGPSRPWLLGSSRAGGSRSALVFATDMALLVGGRSGEPANVLPAVLPPLNRTAGTWLLDGMPDVGTVALGAALVGLLDRARLGTPSAPPLEDTTLDGNDEGLDARLRLLADDVRAIAEGYAPAGPDLARAPTLVDWRYESRPRRILSGVVRGHPGLRDGRRITTSELFASDGRTWARTLSRWYRLDRRSEAESG